MAEDHKGLRAPENQAFEGETGYTSDLNSRDKGRERRHQNSECGKICDTEEVWVGMQYAHLADHRSYGIDKRYEQHKPGAGLFNNCGQRREKTRLDMR